MKSSVILHGFSDSQQMQTKKAFATSSSLEYWSLGLRALKLLKGVRFLLLIFAVLSVILFLSSQTTSPWEKKIKAQFFCFSWLLIHYTALAILFGFLNAFLAIWVFSANLSSFWALTLQTVIYFNLLFGLFQAFFLLLYMIFWPLDFIRELLWDALDAHSLNVHKFI